MAKDVDKQSFEGLRKQLREMGLRAQLAEARMRIANANFQVKRTRLLSEAISNKNIVDFIRM